MGNLSFAMIGSLYTFKRNNNKIRKHTYLNVVGLLVVSGITGWIGFCLGNYSPETFIASILLVLIAFYLMYRDLNRS